MHVTDSMRSAFDHSSRLCFQAINALRMRQYTFTDYFMRCRYDHPAMLRFNASCAREKCMLLCNHYNCAASAGLIRYKMLCVTHHALSTAMYTDTAS
eukprot:5174-Heterococcus_DN1.PRE.1